MKINLTDLITKDLAALSQRIITASEEPTFEVVRDNPLLEAVKSVYAEYDAVYTKNAFSGKGKLLIAADHKRDTPFGGLKYILLGYTKLSSSPYQQDAKDIYAVIEKFGIDLDRYKWAQETAQLKKLLEELYRPENAEKIDRMQLSSVVDEIRDAQTAFEVLFLEIAGENSQLHNMESATSFRKTMEKSLRNYFNLVTAMKQLPGWSTLDGKLDELIKTANNSKQKSPKPVDTPVVAM